MPTRKEKKSISFIVHHLHQAYMHLSLCSAVWDEQFQDNTFSKDYPFDRSFDEVIKDISRWKESIENTYLDRKDEL